MSKLARVSKVTIDADFPAAADPAAAPAKTGYVQQQQRQDPQWLADIKREQQQQCGAGDLFGFNFPVM